MKFLLLSVFLVIAGVCSNARILPNNIQGCKRTDPNVNKCAEELLNRLRSEFVKGIPSIKLPAIDPFKLPVLNIDEKLEGIAINGKFIDVLATGGNKFVIEEMTINPTTFDTKIKIKLEELKIAGDYDLNGKILQVPLNIKGKATGEFKGITANVDIQTNEIEKSGVKYLKIMNIIPKINVANGKLNLVETNTKNQQAADIAMTFFNENSADVLQTLSPIIDETASEIIKSILSEMLEIIPSEELFPK